MVNPPGNVAEVPSGLVTTTFHCPVPFPVRSKVQVIFVGETPITPVAGISGLPVFVSFTVAPETKPVPIRSVMLTALVFMAVEGVMLETARRDCPGTNFWMR